MNRKKKTIPQDVPWVLLILAVCCLIGIILGQVAADTVSSDLQAELEQYLRGYTELEKGQLSGVETVWNAVALYLRYPLLAFLLGFASVGVVLLPCLAILFGFGVSFSIGCFTATFGPTGVWLAGASFGLRTLVTFPCFLLLAVPAWETAFRLMALSFGRGRRVAPVIYGKAYWVRFGVIFGILLAGVCGDLWLTPKLLGLILT